MNLILLKSVLKFHCTKRLFNYFKQRYDKSTIKEGIVVRLFLISLCVVDEEGIVIDLFLVVIILHLNLVGGITQEPLGVGPSYFYPR